MTRRVLILGVLSAILIAAVIVNLAVLDVISTRQLTDTLGRSLVVVAITTLAVVLMMVVGRMGRRPHSPDPGAKS